VVPVTVLAAVCQQDVERGSHGGSDAEVTKKNWIRRLWKLDVKSPSCHGANSSTRRIHMMTRHPSRAEVVPESAFRAPKVMCQVGAAIFSHPDSDMQAI